VFTGWIYESTAANAAAPESGPPVVLRAIAAAKRRTITSTRARLRLPTLRFSAGCYMASTAIRPKRRRTLRYRQPALRDGAEMRTQVSGLLRQAGVNYNKQRLHKAGYFRELLATNPGHR